MVISFFNHQLEYSENYRKTFASLAVSKLRTLQFDGFKYVLQLNPGRIKSSTANISKPLSEDNCFLCRKNMPECQLGMDFNKDFTIFVNPFPILGHHLTIVSRVHRPQSILGNTDTMLSLAKFMPGMVVFYNSPKSGASAPFHMHFQAGDMCDLPVFEGVVELTRKHCVASRACTHKVWDGTRRLLIIESTDMAEADEELRMALQRLSRVSQNPEPEANIGAMYADGLYRIVVFPRGKHRPDEYFRESNRILVSPGFADMAGIIPCSIPDNYESITDADIVSIMNQVTISEEIFEQL